VLQSYEDLYRALNANKVKYVIIGGVAVNLYGVIRATKDVDLFIEASIENATRLLKAMEEARFGTASLISPAGILKKDVTIFNDILRIDVLVRMKNLDFEKVWQHRKIVKVKDIKINLISIDDLILSKKQAGRTIDLQDVGKLKKIKKLKRGGNN
jgi:predicted nucleotidyltransferase